MITLTLRYLWGGYSFEDGSEQEDSRQTEKIFFIKCKRRLLSMKIVTISREFGSGGRELGKRLADALGVPCYDHEIIEMVAEKHGFDKNYVSHISEKDIRVFYPSTVGNRFMNPSVLRQPVKVVVA